MKILIPTSPGGHLKQSLMFAEGLKRKFDITFVTYYTALSEKLLEGHKTLYVVDPGIGLKSIPNKVAVMVQALWILLKENPDAIVSPGSNVPVPFCYLGKLLGKKIIYIESWSRVKRPSRSGKIVYPIADLFFIQWKDLKRAYPKAVYAGRFM